MSTMIDAAVAALSARINGDIDGTAKFVITGEGSIMIDATGVHAGDGETDVTLTADAEVFQSILAGETNATVAFMTGKLAVDGSMAVAMQVGAALT